MKKAFAFKKAAFCALAVFGGAAFAQAPAPKALRIGAALPLSGPVAFFGEQARDGMLLALKGINASGGVDGSPLELVVRDDQAIPDKSIQAWTELVDVEKVHLVLGSLTSRCTGAVAPLAQARSLPLLTPSATSDRATEAGNFIFRACYNDSYQGVGLAYYARFVRRAASAAVLYDPDDDFAVTLMESFVAAFEGLGGRIAARQTYSSEDGGFESPVAAVMDAAPDLVFLPAYFQMALPLLKQARALGLGLPMLGPDSWDGVAEAAGAEALNFFYCNHYDPGSDSPLALSFRADFAREYGREPNALAALGYDSALLAAAALRKAGGDADGPRLRSALASLDMELATGRLRYDSRGNPVKAFSVIEVVPGEAGKLATRFACSVDPDDYAPPK